MKEGLVEVGTVTLKDAVERFEEYGPPGDRETHAATAAGLKVRVRASGLVEIEQSKPKTTGRHPEYGGAVMTEALLPAREATQAEATAVLEQRVVGTLRDHGF